MRRAVRAVSVLALLVAVVRVGPTRPAAAEGAVPTTLQEIQETFDDQEKAAVKAVKRRRYDQVLAYVAARPGARDAAEARAELFRLASSLEGWEAAVAHADDYLARHPMGADEVGARFARAEALGKLGRGAEARAAWEQVVRAVSPSRHGAGAVLGAYTAYTSYLTDQGDLEGARAAWRGFKAATASSTQAQALAGHADDEMRCLDLVRRPARPFPADTVDLDGRPIALEQYRGKVLLIEFWATWCGPCKDELPALLSAYERYRALGFEIVGVTIDAASEAAKVREFVREKQIPWRVSHSTAIKHPAAATWEVRGIPQTVLIDREGRVVRVGLRGMALVREIGRLLR